jgi:hypothetical protein
LLPLVLVAHGALVWWAYLSDSSKQEWVPRNLYLLSIPFFLGAGLLLSGIQHPGRHRAAAGGRAAGRHRRGGGAA